MKIAVNGKSFGTAEKGGAIRVAINVVKHIAEAAPGAKLDVFVPVAQTPMPTLGFPANVHVATSVAKRYASGSGRTAWEQIVLPRLLRRQPYDLLLNLTNSAPFLIPSTTPQVLLVHDAGFARRGWFAALYSRYVLLSLRLARYRTTQLATVSGTSASELAAALSWTDAIEVIPNGVDPPPTEIAPPRRVRPYLLFLGSINPRKNLAGTIEAFAHYRAEHGGERDLVVAGAHKTIFGRDNIDSAKLDGVDFVGYVDDKEKWSLLQYADALILPSFVEGFGIPVAEALSVGTPVVASDIAVFHEFFDGVVEFVDPHDPRDIAGGIANALRSSATIQRRAEDGRELVKGMTWEAAAANYLRMFATLTGDAACPDSRSHAG